jgi:hypothetical protein
LARPIDILNATEPPCQWIFGGFFWESLRNILDNAWFWV